MRWRFYSGSVLSLLLGMSALAEDVITPDLTGQLQLFVDRHGIQSLDGVQLKLHSPERKETAITFDAPWEGPESGYVTVFVDPQDDTGSVSTGNVLYRMYYRGYRGPDRTEATCYAESIDGIHWIKPELGLVEWNGSKQNNILLISIPPDRTCHNFTPFRDTNPNASPDARYKAVGGSGEENSSGMHAFKSADGIRWERMAARPMMPEGRFDTQNLAYWDADRQKYVFYFRILVNRVRTIAMSESKDFLIWSKPVPIAIEGDPEHFYTNAITPYFRQPRMRFAFPKRLVPDRQLLKDHPRKGISDVVFLSSRDGLHFDRLFPESLLRPGRDERNWGDRSLMTAWGIVPTADDEMSIYVSENFRFDTHRLTRFVFRTDGIASAHAGATAGELVTTPFRFRSADKLLLNFSTSAAGSIQVEVQEADGMPIPGFTLDDAPPLYGDEMTEAYVWKPGSDVSSLAGRPIRLRFILRDGDLFSYRFE